MNEVKGQINFLRNYTKLNFLVYGALLQNVFCRLRSTNQWKKRGKFLKKIPCWGPSVSSRVGGGQAGHSLLLPTSDSVTTWAPSHSVPQTGRTACERLRTVCECLWTACRDLRTFFFCNLQTV